MHVHRRTATLFAVAATIIFFLSYSLLNKNGLHLQRGPTRQHTSSHVCLPNEGFPDCSIKNFNTVAKVLVFTGSMLQDTRFRPVYQDALDTHIQHGQKHAHKTFIFNQEILPSFWNKEAAVLEVLLQQLALPQSDRVEWLFYCDIDTVILNPSLPLDIFLPPPRSRTDGEPAGSDSGDTSPDLLISSDNLSTGLLNAGAFFIRVSSWSVRLMSAVITYRDFYPHVYLEHAEQTALQYLLRDSDDFKKKAVVVPQRWFNAYPETLRDENGTAVGEGEWTNGDMLVHFAGVGWGKENGDELKVNAIKEWVIKAQKGEGSMAMESTNVVERVRKFWSDFDVHTRRSTFAEDDQKEDP